MAVPTKEECVQSDILATQIEKKIEEMNKDASQEDYQNICKLLDEERCVDVSTKSQRIYILEMLGIILKAELQKGIEHNIFEGRNIEELIALYKKITMLLRRIEFDFPLEYQMELYEYIIDERISLLAVIGIIQRSEILIDKEKIRRGLVKILQYGYDNE